GSEHLAVGGDYLARQKIVDRHAVLPKQPADTTPESETCDTSFWHYAGWHSKTEGVRFAIQVTKSRAALHANCLLGRIHVDRPHSREVYNNTVIAECAAAHVMPTTTDRREQIIRPSEVDSGNDVCDAVA